MKKQIQIFMLNDDEHIFSNVLKKHIANIAFLDNNIWESSPCLVDSIEKSKNRYCYLWNRDVFPYLSVRERKDGKIQGPIAGEVIQFQRSEVKDGFLLSGRIAVGFDENKKEMDSFVKEVWKIINCVATQGVYHISDFKKSKKIDYSKMIKEYIIGNAAKEALSLKEIEGFKHRTTENYYHPCG